MSQYYNQYYKLGGQTLRDPSNGASRLFMSQVTVYQTEVCLSSGIGAMEADECQIDPRMCEGSVEE
ncbi:DUF6086 family protein [[Kitasatospora] papulosa]|uniref:DUF6086 family protein n=1 Tax=[Kitasatospora] papulosa TaxID=1464011 RepID=UPI00380B9B63